jgi:hypothetical protein
MIPELRRSYNDAFDEKVYARVLAHLEREAGVPSDFRISETPIFLPEGLARKLETAAHEVLGQALAPATLAATEWAVPDSWRVPRDPGFPEFAQVDFALAEVDGEVAPRLIELQGFPSLYGFQWLLAQAYREVFPLPAGFTTHFSGDDEGSYVERLRTTLMGDADPEQVVLLEIDPERQKTRIDFHITSRLTGLRVVDASAVRQRGRAWFYERDGREIPIRRVYNRVIVDEVERKGLGHLRELFVGESDVEWVGHPDWYFRISKATLPLLKSEFVPPCLRLSDVVELPVDLENYVLKPFFSFAGLGVELGPTRERLAELVKAGQAAGYLLQRRVDYAGCVQTPDEAAKAEVRMMFLWDRAVPGSSQPAAPRLVNSLVRMSKGRMMGVDFNKNKSWVGASVAFHPPLG